MSRIMALLARVRRGFPEAGMSLSIIWGWCMEQLGLQKKWSGDARAIDDPLESALAVFEKALPTLKASLANDTPAQRREIMRAAHAVLAAAKETHRRTELLAQEITPQ